jgi:hypothetical protein
MLSTAINVDLVNTTYSQSNQDIALESKNAQVASK